MPNHCSHDLTVTGPALAIATLIQTYLTPNGEIDENKVVPYPEHFLKLDEIARNWKGDVRKCPKDGFNSGGYEWCLANWGTKWGTYHGKGIVEIPMKRKNTRKIFLQFDTAWGPGVVLYTALAKLMPECTFTYRYYECGMQFQGKLVFKNGTCIVNTRGTYTGRRGG